VNYYNEIDPYCAAWLQNLMDAGHIAKGVIDTRSIEDVTPNDLRGFVQCHFFAGLGGWAYALDLAGWPRDRPVWTGSCPCQPFSAAGKGAGFADERHLWPAWQHLIAQCRPPVVFGEQVASKAVDAWIDLVHADMEGMGYAFGGIAFPSAGVGAPHIRDRTYWVADANSARSQPGRLASQAAGHGSAVVADGGFRGLADAEIMRREGQHVSAGRGLQAVGDADIGGIGGLADADSRIDSTIGARTDQRGLSKGDGRRIKEQQAAGPTNGFWRAADWLGCTDGKWRPVEPGTFPLVDGAASRVGRLRAYGNAINAEAARAFIESYCETRGLMGLERAA